MALFIFLVFISLVISLFINGLILKLVVANVHKIEVASYNKSLLIVVGYSVTSILFAVLIETISGVIRENLVFLSDILNITLSILVWIFSYFIFKYFFKKYYPIKKGIIKVFIIYLILSTISTIIIFGILTSLSKGFFGFY